MSIDDAITSSIQAAVAQAVRREVAGIVAEMKSGKLLCDEKEAAEKLSVSVHWLRKLRLNGKIQPTRRSKPVLYSPEDLARAIDVLRD